MKNLVIVGAGGMGKEVSQYIKDINRIQPSYNLLGYIDEDLEKKATVYNGVKVLGDFSFLQEFVKEQDGLLGFCAVANPMIRQKLTKQMRDLGLSFINVIHPTAYIGDTVKMGEGILTGPYTVITANIEIGDHVHINPQCGIGHDSKIGEYSTLYWSVNISGSVTIEPRSQIGSKAFIKQGLTIGAEAMIGAGAVVVKDVPQNILVTGVPAKPKEQEETV